MAASKDVEHKDQAAPQSSCHIIKSCDGIESCMSQYTGGRASASWAITIPNIAVINLSVCLQIRAQRARKRIIWKNKDLNEVDTVIEKHLRVHGVWDLFVRAEDEDELALFNMFRKCQAIVALDKGTAEDHDGKE